jgi:hypothetical protein
MPLSCRAMLLALALLPAAAATAQEPQAISPDPPEGYPWVLGEASISLDGAPRSYTTFDFSIGAFDASVQFRDHYDCSGDGSCKATGRFLLSLGAYPDGNPDAEADIVVVQGIFDKLPDGPKRTRNVTVEIRNLGGQSDRSLMAKGPAKLTPTSGRTSCCNITATCC